VEVYFLATLPLYTGFFFFGVVVFFLVVLVVFFTVLDDELALAFFGSILIELFPDTESFTVDENFVTEESFDAGKILADATSLVDDLEAPSTG